MGKEIIRQTKRLFFLNVATTVLFVLLPYFIFEGRYYIGGDDTRLFYLYPVDYIQHIALYSWTSFSSLGSFNPNQFSLPFLTLWALLSVLIQNHHVLDYLSFSLPFIIGFLSFQLCTSEFFEKGSHGKERYIGSLLYVLSPLTAVHQISVFLITVWFFAVLPLFVFLFIRFIKTGNYTWVYFSFLAGIVFSLSFYAIPWVLGAVLPLLAGVLLYSVLLPEKLLVGIRRGGLFLAFLGGSQLFWLLPFLSSVFIKSEESFVTSAFTSSIVDTFRPTVLATATGNIVYPLLNLPHRNIAFDFNWELKDVFLNFYDFMVIPNLLFVLVIFLGVLFRRQVLTKGEQRIYISLFAAFLVSLAFFTVNIGPFKELFLMMGNIPGFAMFRNFYDKFSLGYIFLYTSVFTYGLVIITRKKILNRSLFLSVCAVVIILNSVPLKEILNAPLWGTKNIQRNTVLGDEYVEFISRVKETVPATANIISTPTNIASYAFIKGQDAKSYYVGTSPVTLFTGINNVSGNLSFDGPTGSMLSTAIQKRDYQQVIQFLHTQKIEYLLETKQLPKELRSSYLFEKSVLDAQDETFIRAITDRQILTSRDKTYILYKIKSPQRTQSSREVTLIKISPVKYIVRVKNMKSSQKVTLPTAAHSQWNLYPADNATFCQTTVIQAQCQALGFDFSEMGYLFKDPLPSEQRGVGSIKNNWNITQSNSTYIIYFQPQAYFYVGILLSILSLGVLFVVSKVTKHA